MPSRKSTPRADRRLALSALAAVSLSIGVFCATDGLAQQKPPAAGKKPPAAQLPTFQADGARGDEMQSIWAKLCGDTPDPKDANRKVKVCTTQFEVLNKEAIPILGGAVTSVQGQAQELFTVTVPQGPQGIAIRPGVRVKIDDGEPLALQYTFCFVHGCMAETPAAKEMVDRLKGGKAVVIGLFDTAGRVLSLPVPLEGFAVAYGGPSIDPKKYVELRQKMVDEYRKQRGLDPLPAAASAAQSSAVKSQQKK